MLTKKVDKSKSKIGLVSETLQGQGKTGFQLEMLHRSRKYIYDCTEEVYQYIEKGRYGHYPNVMELFYIPIFDDQGVIVQLLQADHFQNENCLVETSFGLATYSMFRYQITEKTLKAGDFFKLDGCIIRLADDFLDKKDQLVYLEYEGAIQEPRNGMMFKMAEDFDIYTLDWSKSKKPFSINCTREQAIENGYGFGFSVGRPEDIENSYWIWFGSLRGDDTVIDAVCCFLNEAPGWSY